MNYLHSCIMLNKILSSEILSSIAITKTLFRKSPEPPCC